MKKRILCFILAATVSVMATERIRPLSDAVDQIKAAKDEPDLSELGYVGIRCAALYLTVSAYWEQGATKEEDQKIASEFKSRGMSFLKVGHFFSTKNKMDNDGIKRQLASLQKFYAEEMLESKRLNNFAFSKLMESDMKLAEELRPAYTTLLDRENAATGAK